MPHHTAIFHLRAKEPGEYDGPWPEPDPAMAARFGWTEQRIPLDTPGSREGTIWTADAMVRRVFAVHRMITFDPNVLDDGWAISIRPRGFRLTVGGRVFARCLDAMIVAERLAAEASHWEDLGMGLPFTPLQRGSLLHLFDGAERAGQILRQRVDVAG